MASAGSPNQTNACLTRRPSAVDIPLVSNGIDVEVFSENERLSILRTWQTLVRHKLLIAFVALACGALGYAVARLQTPVYRAATSLEVQGLNDAFLNLRDTSAVSPSIDLQAQVRILQSRTLRLRAMEVWKAEFGGVPEPKTVRSHPILSKLGLGRPITRQRALSQAAGSLVVMAPRDSRILDIVCDSADPLVAAQFANVLATEFVNQNLEWRWENGQRTSDWLTRTLQDLKLKLQDSERKLLDFAHASALVFKDEKDTAAEDSLKQLQGELWRARSERLNRQANWKTASSNPAEYLPETLTNGALNPLRTQLTDLRRQYAELRATFTPAYPKLQRIQAQINELEEILKKDQVMVVNRIHTDYDSALSREKLLEEAYDRQVKVVAEQAGQVLQYDLLKREVDGNRRLYDNLLQKVKEAGISAAMRANNIRIVDRALPPAKPFKPRPIFNTAVGFITGLFVGAIVVLGRQLADRSIRRPGDAQLFLNVPELGAIPIFKAEPLSALERRRLLAARNGRFGKEDRVELVTWHHKPSVVAESFRATLASILFSHQREERPKVMAITSPGAREGKTNVISNLGIALAEIGRRVVLLDGDMRAPALHRLFDLPNDWGLSDLLQRREPIAACPVEALARKTQIP